MHAVVQAIDEPALKPELKFPDFMLPMFGTDGPVADYRTTMPECLALCSGST